MISAYENAPLGEEDRIRYLAAEAWNDRALMLVLLSETDKPTPDPQDLEEAIQAWQHAVALSRRPDRKAVFSVWQTQIHLMLENCEEARLQFKQAVEYRREYLEKNPSAPDPLRDSVWDTVEERIDIACKT